MAAGAPVRLGLSAQGVPASLLLHLALLLALGMTSLPPRDRTGTIPESGVDVELLTAEEFEATTRPRPAEPALEEPTTAPEQAVPGQPEKPPPAEPDGMIRASRLMAADALANPLSRQAREMLPFLAEDERVEQLCGLEAMSQIHAWKAEIEPDRVTAYARGETRITGRTLLAEGAAFRSRRRWYALSFRCEFSADRSAVVAFAFRVGDAVPRGQWRRLGLPETH